MFGVIEEIFVPDGEKVVAGDQLCKIKVSGKYMHMYMMESLNCTVILIIITILL